MRFLTAIPIYNEERSVEGVLAEVRRYSSDILIINDGSTDKTGQLLACQPDLRVITHARNRGYGAALISAFAYLREHTPHLGIRGDAFLLCDPFHARDQGCEIHAAKAELLAAGNNGSWNFV